MHTEASAPVNLITILPIVILVRNKDYRMYVSACHISDGFGEARQAATSPS